MNYNQGVNHMRQLTSMCANSQRYQNNFVPYQGIIIEYPGYKCTGDYRLTLQGANVPTHSDICFILYNLIYQNQFSFQTLQYFLSDIYTYGTDAHCNSNLEYLKHLIYWITLQEEINYPRSQKYAGINLPFCRFFEAIYATLHTNNITLRDVQDRCNNHGRNRPDLYLIANSPSFYHY